MCASTIPSLWPKLESKIYWFCFRMFFFLCSTVLLFVSHLFLYQLHHMFLFWIYVQRALTSSVMINNCVCCNEEDLYKFIHSLSNSLVFSSPSSALFFPIFPPHGFHFFYIILLSWTIAMYCLLFGVKKRIKGNILVRFFFPCDSIFYSFGWINNNRHVITIIVLLFSIMRHF